ncbi:hypothetical protein [Fictibacillus sp. NRS-1165]|uniref:hypothetical protein n=1 Tax=Fictibacillus sp. NRS-1165 TaxID=3144463 RepID=UPI003D1F3CFE
METLSTTFKTRISNTKDVETLKEELVVIQRIYSEQPKYRREMSLKMDYIENRIKQLEK